MLIIKFVLILMIRRYLIISYQSLIFLNTFELLKIRTLVLFRSIIVCVLISFVSGSSKGIAIVRFKSTEIATEVLETYPQIEIMDTVGWFEFGFEHTDDDWTCKICNNINFRHRSVCFKCLSPKILKALESTNYGQDDISKLPTRFLLLRNIDNSLSAKKVSGTRIAHFRNFACFRFLMLLLYMREI